MIDIKDMRADPDKYIQAAAAKRIGVDIQAILDLDQRVLDLQRSLQEARTAQNAAGKNIAKLKGDEKQAAIAEMARIKEKAKADGDALTELEPTLKDMLLIVPQPPAADVPPGKDDTENVEVRRQGEVRKFDFEPKDHIQLGEALDIIDVERGVKLAGTRNYILKGAATLLHQAVLKLAQDILVSRGYTPLVVPVLVREEVMYGTGYFPLGRDQAYLCERDGLSLVGTAEVSVTALHSDEILEEAALPKKYCACPPASAARPARRARIRTASTASTCLTRWSR